MAIVHQIVLATSLFVMVLVAPAAEWTLKTTPAEPIAGVAPAIQASLGTKKVQLLRDEGPVYELVLCKSIALKGAPEELRTAMKQVAQGTLLGVLIVHKDERDYRDDEVATGVYTMRFALQPQDGDHLGSAEYPYFALLIPAAGDTEVDGIMGYDHVTEASKADTATEHPVVISLRPGDKTEVTAPEIREPLDEHKSVLMTVPATLPDGKKTTLSFEVVYEGMGEL